MFWLLLTISIQNVNRWRQRNDWEWSSQEIQTKRFLSLKDWETAFHIFFLTYRGAVEQHLLQAAAVVVESQVPGSGVHVLDEARFLEATQQQAFGSFGAWDGISQRSGQRLPVQQFHKVKLEAITKREQDRILGLHTKKHVNAMEISMQNREAFVRQAL